MNITAKEIRNVAVIGHSGEGKTTLCEAMLFNGGAIDRMGKVEDVAVDAWFTGFAETAEGKRYFCVYLGRTDGREVSSTLAREIAIRIL